MAKKEGYWLILDSYAETNENTIQQNMKELNLSREQVLFLKRINFNADFGFAMRYSLGLGLKEQVSILQRIVELLKKVLGLEKQIIEIKKIEEVKTEPITEPEVKLSRIKKWADAIAQFENTSKTLKNNPGAIRGIDGKFLQFKVYSDGYDYLCNYLTRACLGEHRAYPRGGETTLLEFTSTYAPSSDNNNPERYCEFVAKSLSVDKNIRIKELL